MTTPSTPSSSFVLSKLPLALALLLAVGAAIATPVPLNPDTAAATVSQVGSNLDVRDVVDGVITSDYDGNGWALGNGQGYPQTAVFETMSDIGYAEGTRLTFTLTQVYTSGWFRIGCFRLSATTDPRSEFADGRASNGDVTANWNVLTPVSVTALNTTGAIRPDGSILMTTTNPAHDIYTVVADTPLLGITGFRIELLMDSSLATGGPGVNSGNIVLSEMTVDAEAHALPPEERTWKGSVSTDWQTPGNWEPAGVPGERSAITIDPGSTISLNGTVTIRGVMNWNGGGIIGDGALIVAPTGVLNLGGNDPATLARMTLVNQGTVNWTGPLSLVAHFDGNDQTVLIDNQVGGLLSLQSDASLTYSHAGAEITGWKALFQNKGTLSKTGGTGTSVIQWTVDNQGLVEISAGSVRVADYSSSLSATLSVALGGNALGAGLSQFQVDGTAAFDGTLSIVLAGGYVPNIGDRLQVVAGPCKGGFVNMSAADTAAQRLFIVEQSSEGVWVRAEEFAGPNLTLRPLGLSGGHFHMLFSGTKGLNYTMQSSQDLVNWKTVQQFTLLEGTAEVRDAVATDYGFYRVIQP